MSLYAPYPDALDDADASADAQEDAVSDFTESCERELADFTPVELEEACQQAQEELGPHATAQQVEARARELLRL